MPAVDEVKPSWADEIELDSGILPPQTESRDKGLKILTEYKYNKDDKKVKVVRTYKILKQNVPKSVARRKALPKFGDSKEDKPGPSPVTTQVAEDVSMQFITNKEEEKVNENAIDPSKNFAKCRICNGDHWSVNCPYKGTSMDNKLSEAKAPAPEAPGSKPGKYIPPYLKDSKSSALAGSRNRDDAANIRISNLSESMQEPDLEDLIRKIGPYQKMYLARDRNTGLCKGFAYVTFRNRNDAAKAIQLLNGHGYDHLILNVEWSKPQNQN